MARYVWRDGEFRDRKSGEVMHCPFAGQVVAPIVASDIPEYRSPIDGKLITSRSQRREDLKRNNCVEIDPPQRPRGYRNPRFAKKHGLALRED